MSVENQLSNLLIESSLASKLNFASYQSSFALLRDLQIVNKDLDNSLIDLKVTISSNPEFITKKIWSLDQIAPGRKIIIEDRNIELDGNFLLQLNDTLRGTVKITVAQNGTVIQEKLHSVDVLAYNEWGGAEFMPELLAAFVTPNDPVIDRILHDASLVLRQAGKLDHIDGYKSNSRQRVWELISAIYTAIANLGITYSLPPASFERNGQKIRLPSQIIDNPVATCLDTSLLFASALEQAGLNPIIALPKGHAIVGVWLQPEELASIVIDNAETLRKRSQLGEMLLIETTLVTSSPAAAFSQSTKIANEKIDVTKDDTFEAAIDIRQARAHQIKPLSLRGSVGNQNPAQLEVGVPEVTFEEAPDLPDFDDQFPDEQIPETPEGRLERWQRKLLDLSVRNTLLNHRAPKTSLHIICPDPSLLEDKLAEGVRISIKALPNDLNLEQDHELHQQRTGEDITAKYASAALEKKQVLVDLPAADLDSRVINIYRKSQTALQEGDANTLYLALGYLLWRRDIKDKRTLRAPLILLPVTLERKSVRSGVKMLASSDEPRFNTTLLEMLSKDFNIIINGLNDELPTDESGIDIDKIWNIVRQQIKDIPGFEVVEDVYLGHFSFAKFLMWKDLTERTDELRTSPLVKHLIDNPREAYPSDVSFVATKDLDRDYQPTDLLVPLPADSSQMAAIATADRGKDFIIIGPPGTGKSQTISNLIAHMLGKGKTVLFVSEKTAALEVVYRRLEDIGIGQFCLELHSNKSRKADVLKQLGRAWKSQKSRDDGTNWSDEANRLRRVRDQLNDFVDQLHCPQHNGMTAYQAMGISVRDKHLADRVSLAWSKSDVHDKKQLQNIKEAVKKFSVQFEDIGKITNTPLQLVAHTEWSPQWETNLITQAQKLAAAATTASQAAEDFLATINIEISSHNILNMVRLEKFAAKLIHSYRKQITYALENDVSTIFAALEEAIQRLTTYAKAQSELSCSYDPMAWRNLNGAALTKRWQEASQSWWLEKLFHQYRIIKEIQAAGAYGKPDLDRDLITLQQLRVEGEALDKLNKTLTDFKDWHGHDTSPEVVQELLVSGKELRKSIQDLVSQENTSKCLEQIHTLLCERNDELAPDALIGKQASIFIDSMREYQQACSEFEAVSGQAISEAVAVCELTLADIHQQALELTQQHNELHNWCRWQKRKIEVLDLGLKPLVTEAEAGNIAPSEIVPVFEAAYCKWWSSQIITENEVLRNFQSSEHSAAITNFRELDDKFQELTARHIAAQLSSLAQDPNKVKRKSAWGVLQRELQKKRRHKPVRRLLQEIPEILTVLTPCLMMSPLSVAQYLPAGQAQFDLVIFDEASQITAWDAIGSLARGKQAVIAGDPKQMPPTNFFARTDDDPDGDFEGDLESILDEMLASRIDKHTLNLHYRSRRESLIAFSNSRYYDNRLVTFPAPVQPDNGVKLVSPEGFYARGQARHNIGEAQAIVAEIVRRLTTANKTNHKASIGVVTFNTEQQTLIENLLDNARSKDPSIEWAFSTDTCLEPVFVKNLETVQGDERDLILFSITYGPDQSNHVTMNFGPLNRDGGERRLNVALTRSRDEMMVFSTLSPDLIDLSRTQARAVTDLKHFLEYAKRGPEALGSSVYGPQGDFESPFESAVASSLQEHGWQVHPQVGVSSFRIDLGVVHPDKPGSYLAGVECDGATYHSSAFARERDKIRQVVLEGLGWTLFRVWSTDWWINKEKALTILLKSLNEQLDTERQNQKRQENLTNGDTFATVENDSETKIA